MFVQVCHLLLVSIVKRDVNVETARSSERLIELVKVVGRGKEDRVFLPSRVSALEVKICLSIID